MKTITVSADALLQLLRAITGPGHLIRELQATRSISKLTGTENPINVLIAECQAAIDASKTDAASKDTQQKHSQFLYEHALNEVLMLGYTIKDGDLFPPETGIPVVPACGLVPVAEVSSICGAGPNDVGVRWRGGFATMGELLYRKPVSVQHLPADDTEGGAA